VHGPQLTLFFDKKSNQNKSLPLHAILDKIGKSINSLQNQDVTCMENDFFQPEFTPEKRIAEHLANYNFTTERNGRKKFIKDENITSPQTKGSNRLISLFFQL
jgi:hypothetical protein